MANKVISVNGAQSDRDRLDPQPAQIQAIEHEFKFHEGIWSLTLKDVFIKSENMDIHTDALKVIAVTMDQDVKRRRRRNVSNRIHN